MMPSTSLGHPEDPSFGFLAGTTVVYYAGLDESSLPFNEGKAIVEATLDEQITFLKALSLVADFVVIPPSFYFYWASLHRDSKRLSKLAELYQAGILLSPIYSSMTGGVDFLDYKMATANTDEKRWLSASKSELIPFFRALPIHCRDVTLQSRGFRNLIVSEVERLSVSPQFRESLLTHVRQPRDDRVLASRAAIHSQLMAAIDRAEISPRVLRQLFYAANRAYYLQGSRTYGASVSLVGAPRYSILGPTIFSDELGVLVAYDPRVILGILRSLGIEPAEVAGLTVDRLIRIRRTREFHAFKSAYRELALALQMLEIQSRQLSRPALAALQEAIVAKCTERFHHEESRYLTLYDRYDLSEMIVSSVGLGAIGMALVPVAGFALGLLPVALHAVGLTPGLGRFIVARIAEDSTLFYRYVRAVRESAEEAERLANCGET